MLRAALAFFIIGIIAYVVGAYNIAGVSIEVGKIIMFIFLILAVLSFLLTLLTGTKPKNLT
jgi:uncharacterized membrane protein YtjA (UPF0391 family)